MNYYFLLSIALLSLSVLSYLTYIDYFSGIEFVDKEFPESVFVYKQV